MLSNALELYITAAHECPYLEERKATNLLVDPAFAMDTRTYSHLLNKGFRRSGSDVYRPCCYRCQACVSTRIPVESFKPSRSQKRTWNLNQDLSVRVNQDGYREEYTDLYLRYVRSRHAGGGMDDDTPSTFANFILTDWCQTVLIEFWKDERLMAVASTDWLKQGLSSVYTFFDPEEGSERGLGTFALLWQIHWAKELKLPYVYPGYWIKESPKMNYKVRFQPIEGFVNNQWVPIAKAE
jgi:arginine-tRNA-protein transferase